MNRLNQLLGLVALIRKEGNEYVMYSCPTEFIQEDDVSLLENEAHFRAASCPKYASIQILNEMYRRYNVCAVLIRSRHKVNTQIISNMQRGKREGKNE